MPYIGCNLIIMCMYYDLVRGIGHAPGPFSGVYFPTEEVSRFPIDLWDALETIWTLWQG